MAEGVRYIKIAKKDKNGADQTLTLQSLEKITIPYSTGNITYNILSISEKPTFFQYYVESNVGLNFNDRAEIKYDFTGSLLTNSTTYQSDDDMTGAPDLYIKVPITGSSKDNLGFFHTGSTTNFSVKSPLNMYRFLTYPQETIEIDSTGSIRLEPYATGGGVSVDVQLVILRKGATEPTLIGTATQVNNSARKNVSLHVSNPTTSSFHVSASFSSSFFNPGDALGLSLGVFQTSAGSKVTASFAPGTIFRVSSSAVTGTEMETIPEPYFSKNFKRSFDCQPTFNNVETNRISTEYQDVDYSSDIMSPTNFDLLIAGTALKAQLQDSNYTLIRHTNPRYKGSRSTSQELNTWTEGDVNTYGKSPSVERLDAIVGYADWVGGYPPERMNTFGAHLKYLINDEGNVIIPGTTPNALEDNENTFRYGSFIEISTEIQASNGDAGTFRRVLRGGKRITPILTNQVGHSPAIFSSSIDLTDREGNEIESNVTGDFSSLFKTSGIQQGGVTNFAEIDFNTSGSLGAEAHIIKSPAGNQRLKITQTKIDQGVNLTLKYSLTFKNNNNFTSGFLGGENNTSTAFARIVNFTELDAGVKGAQKSSNGVNGSGNYNNGSTGKLDISFTIKSTDLVLNDEYGLQVQTGTTKDDIIFGTFQVLQTPVPGNNVLVAGLWNSGSTQDLGTSNLSWPNILFASSSAVVNFYGNSIQKPIKDSGFFDFEENWSLLPGDEFRFEGREDRIFIVKEAYVSGSKLLVEVDNPIPSGSNTALGGINLDEFLIRRYVDDPSGLVIEGEKPIGAGPYIIKPQHVSQKLSTNLSNYIQNLKESGTI